MEQDLPNLDEELIRKSPEIRADLAELGRSNLYFFGKAVLGYRDLTKPAHGPLAVFLTENPAQFKMGLMPRDHLKTSLGTIAGCFQKAIRDTNERILLVNESATNAERFLGAIKQHCEANRVFRALYSEVIPRDTRRVKWNEQELVFNRTWIGPEPTFDTIGMTGSMTSRHYTHICIDDAISKEAVQSEKVMADAIVRLKDLTTLLVDPSVHTIWVIGTRWALFDVYSWLMEKFGPRLARFARGAIEDGLPIWPERFSLETLALKRSTMDEYMFSCLMMNNPRNSELQDLNVDDLKFWRWGAGESKVELLARDGITVEESWRVDQLDITTTVDLAPAEKATSDRNAIATVGLTPSARAVVLEAWGKRCTPIEVINHLLELKLRYEPRVFGIEGVAYQKAFKYFLREEAERRGLYLNIEELKSTAKKELRVRGLQPVMAVGRMYIPALAHQLRNEMADFPLGEHDDVVDALSMQLQLWRGQMGPGRWEQIEKERLALEQRIMRKERTLTDTGPLSPSAFDYDDMNQDDLPGPNLAKYLKVS